MFRNGKTLQPSRLNSYYMDVVVSRAVYDIPFHFGVIHLKWTEYRALWALHSVEVVKHTDILVKPVASFTI